MKSLHVLQIQRLGIWTINLTEELNISVFYQYQIQRR